MSIMTAPYFPVSTIPPKTSSFQQQSQQNSPNYKYKFSSRIAIVITLLITYFALIPETYCSPTRLTYNFEPYQSERYLRNRANLGQPQKVHVQLQLIDIVARSSPAQQPNLKQQQEETKEQQQKCILINAANFLLPYSINSSKNLIAHGMDRVLIISTIVDKSATAFINGQFSETQYEITYKNIVSDSNYNFLYLNVKNCSKIVYLQSNFVVSEGNAEKIVEKVDGMLKLNMIYSGAVLVGDHEYPTTKQLEDLTTSNLQLVQPINLTQYLFIFDPIFLKIITPLNFAYYNKYTIDQMIIYPLLALLQNSINLKYYEEPLHFVRNPIIQNHEFQLHQNIYTKNDQFCFLSFPNNPSMFQFQDTRLYLESLENVEGTEHTTLVMYAPYNYEESRNGSHSILPIGLLLLRTDRFNVARLRIRANKTVTSLGAYQSAHTFCHKNSMMVISRQNIDFETNFISQFTKYLRRRVHYYISRFRDEEGKVRYFKSRPRKNPQFRIEAKYYEPLLMHLQIIRADFFKMLYLWILRCAEVDFYQAQASYIFPLLEINNMRIERLKKKLYKVTTREMTNLQIRQIQSLKSYMQWPKALTSLPVPHRYNSLSNKALKRNAPELIPRKIHQVWLGQSQTSRFRQALVETLKKKNPTFEYIMWKNQNVTLQNFPLTYGLMKRIEQLEELQQRSLWAMITDILRLEILNKEGGIYLDFKVQCLKPLDPFLKYEIFFNDMDYTEYGFGDPRFVGNTFMGSRSNSYYLKMILSEVILEEFVSPYSIHIPRMTGAYKLRTAFNLRELFTVIGFGFQLFSQFPGNDKPLKCSVPQKIYQDQQVFEIKSHINDESYRIGIPCREYEQAYLMLYKQLGRTWLRDKDKQIAT